MIQLVILGVNIFHFNYMYQVEGPTFKLERVLNIPPILRLFTRS